MSSPHTSQNDGSLWRLLKQGDRIAFEALYRKYIEGLLHYGERMGTEEEVLKDLVQDLFIEIWKSRERIKEMDNVKFYLFKALRYKIIKYQHRSHVSEPLNQEWMGAEESVEHRILHAEQEGLTAKYLQRAMARLPKRQQEIIHLRFFQGFSNQDIASLMNLQYQSATNLIHRSLKTMRQYLQEPVLHLFWVILVLSKLIP
jgi:RNA polymerase sigma factor (sigma-70 family)